MSAQSTASAPFAAPVLTSADLPPEPYVGTPIPPREPPSHRHPRSLERPHSQRVWLMVLYLVGLTGSSYAVTAISGSKPITFVLSAILFALLAQRAGFGGRSCLLILVPLMGTVVAFRILWRWTDINRWERTVGSPGKSYFRWDRPNLRRSQKQYV